jgi:cytochrome c553
VPALRRGDSCDERSIAGRADTQAVAGYRRAIRQFFSTHGAGASWTRGPTGPRLQCRRRGPIPTPARGTGRPTWHRSWTSADASAIERLADRVPGRGRALRVRHQRPRRGAFGATAFSGAQTDVDKEIDVGSTTAPPCACVSTTIIRDLDTNGLPRLRSATAHRRPAGQAPIPVWKRREHGNTPARRFGQAASESPHQRVAGSTLRSRVLVRRRATAGLLVAKSDATGGASFGHCARCHARHHVRAASTIGVPLRSASRRALDLQLPAARYTDLRPLCARRW